MVYTLGSVVNSVQSEFPAVRLSTLVEHLDSLIRTHAHLMKAGVAPSYGLYCQLVSLQFTVATTAS